jgi:hypothetical protein
VRVPPFKPADSRSRTEGAAGTHSSTPKGTPLTTAYPEQPFLPPTQQPIPPIQHIRTPRNGFGVTALVLGILGVLFGLVPLTFWIAGPLGVIGLILGLIGRGRAKRGEATNRVMATWGSALSGIACVLAVAGFVILVVVLNHTGNELNKISKNFDAYTKCTNAISIDDPNFTAKLDACSNQYGN